MFYFSLEQWRVDVSDSERYECFYKISQKPSSVDLITELYEGVQLDFELHLKAFLPELIGYVYCDCIV